MVTQAPKRSAVLAALAFSLSCVGLIIFVFTQFGGTIPFGPQGYRLHARFKETGLLVPGADVRISGVNVGKVSAVQAEGVNSLVTMDIKPSYVPIPVDTRAILRQKTLLGEAYVALSTGTGSGRKFPDGATIPTSQIQDTQALDQVLGSFNTQTQQNLQALLAGTATALAGRGQTLNDAIGNFDPLATDLSAMVGVLNGQGGDLRQLISSSATVLNTLGGRSADLRSLIVAGDSVLSATAARNAALTATVDTLPPFLTQLRTTLGTLNTTLGITEPSLRALRPVAPLITPALRYVIRLGRPAQALLRLAPSLIVAANQALPSIQRFTAAFHPGVDALLPAAREIIPVVNFVAVYRRELVAAMANLAADMQARGPADNSTGTASYLRQVVTLGRESVFGQSVREPTVRSNTYFSPGELANIATGGLLAANCDHTGNPSEVPLAFGNVPCRLQPKFAFGNGVATAYYPRLTRAPRP